MKPFKAKIVSELEAARHTDNHCPCCNDTMRALPRREEHPQKIDMCLQCGHVEVNEMETIKKKLETRKDAVMSTLRKPAAAPQQGQDYYA